MLKVVDVVTTYSSIIDENASVEKDAEITNLN